MDIGRGAEPPGIHLPQELGEIDYAGAAHQQKDVPGPEAFGFAFSQKAPVFAGDRDENYDHAVRRKRLVEREGAYAWIRRNSLKRSPHPAFRVPQAREW